jgi:hypothetical protein
MDEDAAWAICIFFFSDDNEFDEGDFDPDDVTLDLLLIGELFKFGFIGVVFFKFVFILDGVVELFIFLNVLAIANAGFIAVIKACIFAKVVAGKIFCCLFNEGNAPKGNIDDISNGFIFMLNKSCEREGILFIFCIFCNKGKFDGNGNVAGGVLVFKFKEEFMDKDILLSNVEPNLFKFGANVEFDVELVEFKGNEVGNGNIGGTDDCNGMGEEVVVFFVEVEEIVSLLLFTFILYFFT